MQLIFEKSRAGRGNDMIPACDVPAVELPEALRRKTAPRLPELAEVDIARHYTELAKRTHGVNDGMYPLGSCTMKYNPKVNEEMAALPGFTGLHPLQPVHTVQGALKVMTLLEDYLNEITGMDAMTFQPAAGAHGEFTGLLMIKAYLESIGQGRRDKIIIPDAAHGTNPASCTMAGFKAITIKSNEDGCIDLDELRSVVGDDTAGLMLTNPNTVGIFDKNIVEITGIIHEAGGLNYYDGANLNAVMGHVRPGDMGFDVIHLNLHKTFSTPHGGGGPGSGAVGCKDLLVPFFPRQRAVATAKADGVSDEAAKASAHARPGEAAKASAQGGPGEAAKASAQGGPNGDAIILSDAPASIGRMRTFYGNFGVLIRALCYVMTLGREGIPEASENAVLNANYVRVGLKDTYDLAFDGICMHEFVVSLKALKKESGVSALDVAKELLDYGMHPPTMYFPLIVEEALMIEPTETESKENLDAVIELFREIYERALSDPESMHGAPHKTPVRRLDEVGAARHPVVRYGFDK